MTDEPEEHVKKALKRLEQYVRGEKRFFSSVNDAMSDLEKAQEADRRLQPATHR
jgi:hypothetical protein